MRSLCACEPDTVFIQFSSNLLLDLFVERDEGRGRIQNVLWIDIYKKEAGELIVWLL